MSFILHIVLNDYVFDNRVRRAAEAGILGGSRVAVFALHRLSLARVERHGMLSILRFALTSRPWSKSKPVQLLKYVEAAVRMFCKGVSCGPDVVHAHDADALPIGWLIARCTGARLIYDAHELWSDPDRVHQLTAPVFFLLRLEERTLARRSQCIITVSGRIASYLRATLRVRMPVLVRNLPERWPATRGLGLRHSLKISHDSTIILFQGVISGGGPLLLLKAFRGIPGNAVLVFLGNGSLVEELQRQAAIDPALAGRVFFHPSVPAAALHAYTSSADIGVHPMTRGPLNHAWALPNKLFEYMQGGLAIIASDLPEMAGVIRGHRCGITFPADDQDALRRALEGVVGDTDGRDRYRAAARQAAGTLCWERERDVLLGVYRRLIVKNKYIGEEA